MINTVLAIKIGQVWPNRKKYVRNVLKNSFVGSSNRRDKMPKKIK